MEDSDYMPPPDAPEAIFQRIADQLASQSAKTNELLSSVAERLKTQYPKYLNIGQTTVTAATATKPADPDVIAAVGVPGYDRIIVYHELNRLSPKCWVMNDGPGTLFALATSDGIEWSGEGEILIHEFRAFLNVYEIRVRSPDGTTKFRASEYEPGALV